MIKKLDNIFSLFQKIIAFSKIKVKTLPLIIYQSVSKDQI
jgi:hypothetical protein